MECLVLMQQFLFLCNLFSYVHFTGCSPEFELALYTLAFLTGESDNEITLDTGGESFDLNVKCHKYDGDSKVGSSYVEALAHYE